MNKNLIFTSIAAAIIFSACGGGSGDNPTSELIQAQNKLVGSWLPDVADKNGCINFGSNNYSQYQETIFDKNSTYKIINKEYNNSKCSEENLTKNIILYGDYGVIGKEKSDDGRDSYILKLIHTGTTIKKDSTSNLDVINTGQTYKSLFYFNNDKNISISKLSEEDVNKTLKYILIKK